MNRPSALERMIAAEVEEFGLDYVRGREDRPERRDPEREKSLIFERPTGPEDFR